MAPREIQKPKTNLQTSWILTSEPSQLDHGHAALTAAVGQQQGCKNRHTARWYQFSSMTHLGQQPAGSTEIRSSEAKQLIWGNAQTVCTYSTRQLWNSHCHGNERVKGCTEFKLGAYITEASSSVQLNINDDTVKCATISSSRGQTFFQEQRPGFEITPLLVFKERLWWTCWQSILCQHPGLTPVGHSI